MSDEASEELVVLVNDQNEEIGTAPKATVHTSETPLHRAFSVYIFNNNGEVLTQQRAGSKVTWPLVWSNSCCGHVSPGEDVADAAKRRVQQELHLALETVHNVLPQFRYRVELDGIVENEICPVFLAKTDQQPQPDPSEVAAVEWIQWSNFLTAIHDPNTKYSPWAVLQVAELEKSEEANRVLKEILG